MRMGTPMRASTPSHDAWNPTTPSRSTSWDDHPATAADYGSAYGSMGGASSYLPSTTPFSPFSPAPPGLRDDLLLPRTPSEGVYNPTTPSASYTPHFSPDQPTPRAPSELSTPGFTPYTATPQAYPATPATPGGAPPGVPQTPGTPGATPLGRAAHPATPGAISYETGASVPDEPWTTEGIEVRISDAFRGGQYRNMVAVIVSAGRESCRVALRDKDGNETEVLSVPASLLEPVLPSKKDLVKVIRGEPHKGNVGHLVDIDGVEGVVKFLETLDIQVMPLSLLARYHRR